MSNAYFLCPVYQRYDWGTRSEITDLLALPRPAGQEPVAELWMGAHPGLPSPLSQPQGNARDLQALIAADPAGMLGERHQQMASRLPYLFKVLSAARALSIQVHPSKSEAEAGSARENRLGIPTDAAERNYRDDNHKPELLVALTPFLAMAGFRSPESVATLFDGTGSSALKAWVSPLRAEGQVALEKLFAWCLAQDEGALRQLLRDLLTTLPSQEPYGHVATLHDQFGDDIGVIFPLLLHLHRLSPGDGLFLAAGVPHAYLYGTGLEVMANSDNVLRGGLTAKHMDRSELLAVTRVEPDVIAPLRGDVSGSGGPLTVTEYAVPCHDFCLQLMTLRPGASATLGDSAGPEILLGLSGQARIEQAALSAGSILFLPAAAGPTTIQAQETTQLARVTTGLNSY